jgi:hypothetical protein
VVAVRACAYRPSPPVQFADARCSSTGQGETIQYSSFAFSDTLLVRIQVKMLCAVRTLVSSHSISAPSFAVQPISSGCVHQITDPLIRPQRSDVKSSDDEQSGSGWSGGVQVSSDGRQDSSEVPPLISSAAEDRAPSTPELKVNGMNGQVSTSSDWWTSC